ncbi:MAG TPA: NAD(P)-binding domain-containing protein [Acidimicrobiales bacterium]
MSQRAVFFRERDADLSVLDGETVCVVGFGNLGASMAHNLRDAGLSVTVGNADDEYRRRAIDDGFTTGDIATMVAAADIVYVLVPDEVIPSLWRETIAPALHDGAAACFASGYCLAYGLVEMPPSIDVLLLAPRMLGDEVRRAKLDGSGFMSYVNVEQDASGRAQQRLLALAAAAGSLRKGALQLCARDEALLDLLVEQTVGPYIGTLIQLVFEAGTNAGLPPEALVLELYQSGEMARTFETFANHGFYRSVDAHGLTAQYGGFLRTLEIDVESLRQYVVSVVEDLRAGGFARKFQEEHDAGYPTLQAIQGITSGDDPMTQAEDRVRRALGA